MALLFEPETARRTIIEDEVLAGILEVEVSSVKVYKSKKRRNKILNSYILYEDTPINFLKKLMEKSLPHDEVWSYITNSDDYYVSNYGRAKKRKNGKDIFLLPFFKKDKAIKSHTVVKIRYKDGKIKDERVNRLVAIAFVPGRTHEKNTAKHKNGITDDNKAMNLVWSKNIVKKKTRKVAQIDPFTGELVGEYGSYAQVAKKFNVSRKAIQSSLHPNGESLTSVGYIWRYLNSEGDIIDAPSERDILKGRYITDDRDNRRREVPVLKIDINTGEYIAKYRNCKEAAKHSYMSSDAIYNRIYGKCKQEDGFKWKALKDLTDEELMKTKEIEWHGVKSKYREDLVV